MQLLSSLYPRLYSDPTSWSSISTHSPVSGLLPAALSGSLVAGEAYGLVHAPNSKLYAAGAVSAASCAERVQVPPLTGSLLALPTTALTLILQLLTPRERARLSTASRSAYASLGPMVRSADAAGYDLLVNAAPTMRAADYVYTPVISHAPVASNHATASARFGSIPTRPRPQFASQAFACAAGLLQQPLQPVLSTDQTSNDTQTNRVPMSGGVYPRHIDLSLPPLPPLPPLSPLSSTVPCANGPMLGATAAAHCPTAHLHWLARSLAERAAAADSTLSATRGGAPSRFEPESIATAGAGFPSLAAIASSVTTSCANMPTCSGRATLATKTCSAAFDDGEVSSAECDADSESGDDSESDTRDNDDTDECDPEPYPYAFSCGKRTANSKASETTSSSHNVGTLYHAAQNPAHNATNTEGVYDWHRHEAQRRTALSKLQQLCFAMLLSVLEHHDTIETHLVQSSKMTHDAQTAMIRTLTLPNTSEDATIPVRFSGWSTLQSLTLTGLPLALTEPALARVRLAGGEYLRVLLLSAAQVTTAALTSLQLPRLVALDLARARLVQSQPADGDALSSVLSHAPRLRAFAAPPQLSLPSALTRLGVSVNDAYFGRAGGGLQLLRALSLTGARISEPDLVSLLTHSTLGRFRANPPERLWLRLSEQGENAATAATRPATARERRMLRRALTARFPRREVRLDFLPLSETSIRALVLPPLPPASHLAADCAPPTLAAINSANAAAEASHISAPALLGLWPAPPLTAAPAAAPHSDTHPPVRLSQPRSDVFCGLTTISLQGARALGDLDVALVLRACPRLESLTVTAARTLGDRAFDWLALARLAEALPLPGCSRGPTAADWFGNTVDAASTLAWVRRRGDQAARLPAPAPAEAAAGAVVSAWCAPLFSTPARLRTLTVTGQAGVTLAGATAMLAAAPALQSLDLTVAAPTAAVESALELGNYLAARARSALMCATTVLLAAAVAVDPSAIVVTEPMSPVASEEPHYDPDSDDESSDDASASYQPWRLDVPVARASVKAFPRPVVHRELHPISLARRSRAVNTTIRAPTVALEEEEDDDGARARSAMLMPAPGRPLPAVFRIPDLTAPPPQIRERARSATPAVARSKMRETDASALSEEPFAAPTMSLSTALEATGLDALITSAFSSTMSLSHACETVATVRGLMASLPQLERLSLAVSATAVGDSVSGRIISAFVRYLEPIAASELCSTVARAIAFCS